MQTDRQTKQTVQQKLYITWPCTTETDKRATISTPIQFLFVYCGRGSVLTMKEVKKTKETKYPTETSRPQLLVLAFRDSGSHARPDKHDIMICCQFSPVEHLHGPEVYPHPVSTHTPHNVVVVGSYDQVEFFIYRKKEREKHTTFTRLESVQKCMQKGGKAVRTNVCRTMQRL